MKLIDKHTAKAYLLENEWIREDETVEVRELPGGVSNIVLRISFADSKRDDLILKQAREQLRVDDPWFCAVERIWREVDVLRVCYDCLNSTRSPSESEGQLSFEVPQVLFEDRENYLFAISAAAARHEVWKSQLLRGEVEPGVATACGRLLGSIHQATWLDETLAGRFGDRTFFEDLRIDPYYNHVAAKHSDLSKRIDQLVQSLTDHPLALVHGDFSPKNLLRYGDRLMLVDFEVGHFGDPAFDLGFFLSHLALKAVHAGRDRAAAYLNLTRRFWAAYEQQLRPTSGTGEYQSLVGRSILNCAACMLARVDGKSKVEYLVEERQRNVVRRTAKKLLFSQPLDWSETLDIIAPN